MAEVKKSFKDRVRSLWNGGESKTTEVPVKPVATNDRYRPTADNYTQHNTLFVYSFDGEKNLGEAGPIKDLRPNHQALSMRSWQAFLESEIAATVIGRFCTWMIGTGLKLQSEPPKIIFEEERIDLDVQKFSRSVEARFNLFRRSNLSSYSEMNNLDAIAKEAFKNAIVGGDVLTVLRYEEGRVSVQLIDGHWVQSPFFTAGNTPQLLSNGNTVLNGVERNDRGKHIAYHVRLANMQYRRIPAVSAESGLQTTFMVYGLKYRLNSVRGIPLISQVIESLKKMERYKEATLGSAEERAKIPFFIEHGVASDGENPMVKQMARALNPDMSEDLPKDINANELADLVAASTNKTVYNMPRDSRMKAIDAKNELYFKDFFDVNVLHVCAAINIPVQVAMSMYEGNFSASRAALKDWENTLIVGRKDFSDQFYVPIYAFWLDILIRKGKINAPGYLKARMEKDYDVLEAYRTARYVGSSVPHIDPLKEVKAEREKLGTTGAHIPLTTAEASTERLDQGEASANFEQFSQEIEQLEELGVEPVSTAQPGTGVPTGDEVKED